MKNKNLCLRQTGSFSVTDPFLTTLYYVEKRNGILRKNRGKGLKHLTYPYMRVGGVKNCQNHPYVINKLPLTIDWTDHAVSNKYLYKWLDVCTWLRISALLPGLSLTLGCWSREKVNDPCSAGQSPPKPEWVDRWVVKARVTDGLPNYIYVTTVFCQLHVYAILGNKRKEIKKICLNLCAWMDGTLWPNNNTSNILNIYCI